MRLSKILGLFSAMLLFSIHAGCATMGPAPPVKNPQILKSNLPSNHMIAGVPWYRQGNEECGPTSLAMVLNFYGRNVTKDEISLWLLKAGKHGTNPDDLEYYAGQKQGFKTFRVYDQGKEKTEMKYWIAQGYPLIALGTIPSNWHRKMVLVRRHFVVVVGYDDLKKHFIIQDPAYGRKGREKTLVPYEVFNDFHVHPKFPQMTLVCYPP
jgi:uncharacterized protein YvpB